MSDCIFCKIAKKEIPTDFIYETEGYIVFKDIHPSAPIHLLIVSKNHLTDSSQASKEEWDKVRLIAQELAKQNNLNGFRLAANFGDTAEIKHMHIHFLGKIKTDRKI